LNSEHAPASFTLDEKEGRVYLLLSVANKGVDSAFVAEMIDYFAGVIKKTWADWNDVALQPPAAAKDDEASAKVRAKLLGTWEVESLTSEGETKPGKTFTGFTYTFEGTVCRLGNQTKRSVVVALAAGETPPHLEFRTSLLSVEKGIYKLEDDTLTLCM